MVRSQRREMDKPGSGLGVRGERQRDKPGLGLGVREERQINQVQGQELEKRDR